ncbi:MinD/ParA family protein [Candidatus Acidulodesulfobacterium sp. H_13]|uniref:MinD/ParA family protein n=1 Tax=Candidatus Acidulodesulfobacterium sp. H_13 TaxID=3395470 RepID=UPI003AF6AFBC
MKRQKKQNTYTKIISVTSGKGGVGKTNIVCNLAYCFASMGKRVMIMDADLSLGNVSVVMGLFPKYNISQVIYGDKQLKDVIMTDPNGIMVLPASSGVSELSNLSESQKITLMSRFDEFAGVLDGSGQSVDILLIDTGAGISSNVLYFNIAASEIFVVVTPEPTSITDAYALIKVLSMRYSEKYFYIIINNVRSEREAKEVYKHLSLVSDKFLKVTLNYLGHILSDDNISRSVIMQKPALSIFPDSKASECIKKIAYGILSRKDSKISNGNVQFFLNKLLMSF